MKRSRWLRAAAVRVMTACMGVSMGVNYQGVVVEGITS
jgi:hypothetical protein